MKNYTLSLNCYNLYAVRVFDNSDTNTTFKVYYFSSLIFLLFSQKKYYMYVFHFLYNLLSISYITSYIHLVISLHIVILKHFIINAELAEP